MKKLLILLFSIFFLSSPSVFAEDISDFEIEGISIGDSLLDYMTEDEILEEIELNKNEYFYLNEPYKYVSIYLFNYSSTYEGGLSFIVKNNSTNKYISNKNEKYTITSIRGKINYIEDFDSCIQKRDEIVKVVSNMFPDAQKTERFGKYPPDPSGDSIMDAVYFEFDSGAEIDAYCTNLEENFRIQKNYSEGLNVSISSVETTSWLYDY